MTKNHEELIEAIYAALRLAKGRLDVERALRCALRDVKQEQHREMKLAYLDFKKF